MDFKNIIKLLSFIGMTLGLFFILDILVGILYHELYIDFIIYDAIFIATNFAMWFVLRKHVINLNIKESILTVNLLWILLGIAGAIPLVLYTHISLSSGIFEAISGFTTTGATVYANVEVLPHMILFHRSLMHWLGGLGIVVLGVGLLSVINPTGSLSLFKAESTGISMEKLTPKIKDTALSLWGIYILLTFVDMVLLKYFGMNWFDAVNQAFATISTGGFSTKNNSIAFFHSDGIIWVTTIFMMLSGVNFLAHLKLFYRNLNGFRTEEFQWYITIFLLLGITLTYIHSDISGDSLYDSAKNSFFTIASVMSTTGFSTVNYASWSHGALAVIFLAMLIGGNTGSTAGGIKIIRYVVIFKTLFSELKRVVHPKAYISVFVDGTKLQDQVIASTFGFFFLYVLTAVAFSMFLYVKGFDLMSSITAAVALIGNIGPGFSLVGPANNFGFFSDFDKIILSIGMIIGRLEFYTVLVLFSASFWKKF
jgi:trk system potassium uptake protein